jgi:hypothetical protein
MIGIRGVVGKGAISSGNPMKTRLFFSRCELGAKKGRNKRDAEAGIEN